MIVFSDLDGTLLDHDTYDWQAARPALDELKRRRVPVVLVSSKTLAELEDYRSRLGLRHPVVAENGAAMHVPDDYFPVSMTISAATITRSQLKAAYAEVKHAESFNCEAFFELGLPGIMRETGLTEQQARRANDRAASEPVLWLDDADRATEFEGQMQARGLRCTRGGRFLHLSGDTSKAAAVRQLLSAYAQLWPGRAIMSVALGDGPNDLGMLAMTDIAVIIPGKHEHPMTLNSQNRILKPALPGPAGWNEAMLTLLAEQQDNPRTVNGE
jgi:mannosyl-3-phosphoglycerate phosphatase